MSETRTAHQQLAASSDAWLRSLVAHDSGDSDVPGQLLRAKIGYNPNSSSVGSVVTVLVWSATTASVVMTLLKARAASAAAQADDEDDAR